MRIAGESVDREQWESDSDGEGEGHATTSIQTLADQSPSCNIQRVVQSAVLQICGDKMVVQSDQGTHQGTGLPTQVLS